MERKHIDIVNNAKDISWIHTRPAKNFKFITANGVSFALTENNYYLSSKTDKIKYQFQDCSNASYKHLYCVYMEVYPGIFNYCSVVTEDTISEVLERYAIVMKNLDPEQIELWREGLIRKD